MPNTIRLELPAHFDHLVEQGKLQFPGLIEQVSSLQRLIFFRQIRSRAAVISTRCRSARYCHDELARARQSAGGSASETFSSITLSDDIRPRSGDVRQPSMPMQYLIPSAQKSIADL